MKLKGFLKYLFILCTIFVVIISYNKITTGKSEDNELLSYANVELDMSESDSAKEYLTYKNTNSYPVELRNTDVYVICTGSGENKENDEELVENYLEITAKFKKNMNDEAKDTIIINKKEEVLIEISSNYTGEMPTNPVSCKYGLDIDIS